MTKRKRVTKSPVMFDKAKFLLPKMEFFPVDKETGEGFYIRELNGKDLLDYSETVRHLSGEGGLGDLGDAQAVEALATLVIKCACDENGNPIFSQEDIELLSRKNPQLLSAIAMKAMGVSGIDVDEAKNKLKNAQNFSSITD